MRTPDRRFQADDDDDDLLPPKDFFYHLKKLTITGYYTSEVGATEELHQEIIPPPYNGCAPMNGEAK